jgi:hypothetical protein
MRRVGPRGKRLLALAALVAAPTISLVWSARAVNTSWTFAGSGNWGVASNWNGGVPGAGSSVFITHNDFNTRVITYDYTGPAVQLAGLTIDNTGAGTSVFSQSANSLSVGTFGGPMEIIGNTNFGAGYWSLSGGTHSVLGFLTFANGVGSRGTGTLSGTGSLVLNGGALQVGAGGIGAFTQSGGAITTNNFIEIGSLPGSSGLYQMNGGSINCNFIYAGSGGAGQFNQSAGSLGVAFFMTGVGASAVGTYNLSARAR